jgi:hypothetical protein
MLLESTEILNERLLNRYGKFEDGRALWRVVYSEDQYEKRLTWFTPEGFKLLSPVMVELPKYKQWIHNKYILEKLMPIPESQLRELVGKTSYEPVWTFEDRYGNVLPPKWEAIEIIIRTIHQKSALAVGMPYVDPDNESCPEESLEKRRDRVVKIEEELFGNETDTGDALAHKQAIVVPGVKES